MKKFYPVLLLLLISLFSSNQGFSQTTQTVGYSGTIVNWTVPTGVTSLTIETWGAQGGSSSGTAGGLGAYMKGTFAVTPGQVLKVLVGGAGGAGTQGGGGGGTFVTTTANSPLIIAGGGGGGYYPGYSSSWTLSHGTTSTTGNNSVVGATGAVMPSGGAGPNGGASDVWYYGQGGAGGGGLTGNGANGLQNYGSPIAYGGSSFTNGGAGGAGVGSGGGGGFGGGGGGEWYHWTGGGGGGGYGGGGGGVYYGVGGGGGSYNGGAAQANAGGVRSGHGQVNFIYTPCLAPIVEIIGNPAICPGGTTALAGKRTDYFLASGTFAVSQAVTAEVLVVAGGGGGGSDMGGGGGGGGVLYNASFGIAAGSYPVTVGGGGAGAPAGIGQVSGGNGGNSVFSSFTAIGGGGGGSEYGNNNQPGRNGGSGGGVAGCGNTTFGIGTPGQGFNGGPSGGCYYPSGGGGAGGPGTGGGNRAHGGIGFLCSITGAPVYWGGGGGGSGYNNWGGDGGLGGGGGGCVGRTMGGAGFNPGQYGGGGIPNAQTNKPGGNGGANTGGGGGGGSHYNVNNPGGNGGSGIVIIKYNDPSATWSSSNPGVATVSSTGFVTAVAAGNTTITCTTTNPCGGTVVATQVVSVVAPPVLAGTTTLCIGNSTALTGQNLPTGGNISTTGAYRVHTFLSNDAFVSPWSNTVDVLVVAGGGGGGADMGGGGGGGGVVSKSSYALGGGSYSVVVGGGGTGGGPGTSVGPGANGGNSSLGTLITAIGGGGGASNHNVSWAPAGNGGSGGGSSGGGGAENNYGGTPGAGVGGQGHNGGSSLYTWYPGGGGGAGGPGQTNPAHGGPGVQNAINGTAFYWGGGGGGSGYSPCGGNGGIGGGGGGAICGTVGGAGINNGSGGGGGGGGSQANTPGGNAGANTGGGGGGGAHYNAGNKGGNGGSGIVIIRYLNGTYTSSNPGVATVSSTGVVTAVAGGSTTITYTATTGGCTTNSTIGITVPAPPASPTPVTASPTTFCLYANTIQLNATAPGSTVYWYTTPSGGSAIGSSASGANFQVNPTGTTTYYAEANNGCPSTAGRTAVTVTMVTTPSSANAIEGASTLNVGATTNLTSPLATGGNITKVGGYRIHTFLSSGTLNIMNSANVEVLVVAGGGGGGADMGGGGGGGGVLSSTSFPVSPGSYPVTVGDGGSGAHPRNWASVPGYNGGNSVFGSLTAIGGGGGASFHDANTLNAGNGGSGGGGSGGRASGASYGGNPGAGTPGQGFAGSASWVHWYPGGGGGAGGAGSFNPAHGGPGVLNAILGTPYYWGGGGGGSGYSNIGGNGGIGGGGAGAVCNGGCPTGGAGLNNGNLSAGGSINSQTNVPGGHAGANTGGGGGGGSHYNANNAGGSGGSGIVVVRYLDATGGAGTWSSSNPAAATVNPSTGVVTGVAAGTTNISFTPTNGICSSAPASKTVTVYAAPPAPAASASPANICPGGSSNLNASSSGNLIKWYNAPSGGSLLAATSSGSNFTVTPGGTTTYYAEAVANNPYATSTGGVTESTFGQYRIHRFTGNGTINFLQGGNVEVLVVGGGGGGGSDMGGGGGGGGVIINNSFTVTPGGYNVIVGGGGAGAPASTSGSHPTVPGSNGGNSSFSSLTAIGGGRGGVSHNALGLGIHPGVAGGSGGGASGYNSNGAAPGAIAGGAGTAGQGYRGGNQGTAYFSGGGGGAGGPGSDGNLVAHGGSGVPCSILGTEYWFGGGGGGSGYANQGGNGGKGGGGGGAIGVTVGGTGGLNSGAAGTYGSTVAQSNVPGGNAGANTGGGGGSGSHYYANNKGGDGGTGIVIIRYLDAGIASPRTPVTVTFNPIPAAPTPVTSSATSFCIGTTIQLNAISAGNTIYWYTVPTAGSSIGTSASGANFAVAPTATTTYYAEAYNGCPSASRTAVTVTLVVTPSTPNSIMGSTIMCVGGTSQLTSPLGSGGDLSEVGGYLIHKFTASGTLTFARETNVEVLVVGGGGGGGMDMGGGGGGGGVIYNASFPVTAGSYPITVGAGGTGGPAANTVGQNTAHQYNVSATNGENSAFSSLTAIGGGFGGSSYFQYGPNSGYGNSGGSGGGASGYSDGNGGRNGAGTGGQGYAGGASIGQYYSGGGGGAGGPGGSNVGNGGPGVYNAILGTGYYWGGGGGGAGHSTVGGAGGLGGGGSAPSYSGYGNAPAQGGLNPAELGGYGYSNAPGAPGGNGGVNTGGGGGGGTHYNSNNKGGDGGSGIVVVRYPVGTGTGTWSSSNPSVATINASTGLVTAVTPGISTITYTAVNGICSSPSISTTFTVIAPPAPPSPVSASPTVICPGGSTNISAISAGNNIKWYTTSSGGSPIGSSASGANFLVSPSSTTVYYAETDASSAAPGSQTFNYTGGMQTFMVPAGVTKVSIETYGAQGGHGQSGAYAGGLGARMKGDFNVTPGQSIKVLVGGQGGTSNAGGGGGGTFVTTSSNYPLCVAGGGGGGAWAGYVGNQTYANGTIWDRGQGGISGVDGYRITSYGRPGPQGGGTDYYYRGQGGAGGGGFTGNGDNGLQNYGNPVGIGGSSFINGGAGGSGVGPAGSGGYGGGGGGEWIQWGSSGGGGGYGGGGGGLYYGVGGGGGSYNGGSNQSNSSGVQGGNGLVVFSWSGASLCPSVTRTPVTVAVDPYPSPGYITLDQYEYFAGQTATITCPPTNFHRTQYQWNTTGGAWTDNWQFTPTQYWGTSGSQGQTLYVRAVYRSSGGADCESISNIVAIKVNYSNVGWTDNSGTNYVSLSCSGSTPWCAGSGTYSYENLVAGVNYTFSNVSTTSCNGTAMNPAYLQVWWPGNGTECGYTAIDYPGINSYTFTTPYTGTHLFNVSSNLYTDNNSCGNGQSWDGFTGGSAYLDYRQNTTITNTTSSAPVGSGVSVPLTYILGGAHNNPLVSWSIIASTGSAGGTFSGNDFITSGTGTVTIRVQVGVCYSDVTITISSTENNPGAIQLSASTVCPGTSVTADNVIVASTGSPPCAGPFYYWYYNLNGSGYVLWAGPTSLSSIGLPAVVTSTPGNHLIARNSAFSCTGQANNSTTLDIPITVLNSSASTPVATGGTGSTCTAFNINWTGLDAVNFDYDVATNASFSPIDVVNNANTTLTTVTVGGLSAGNTYYYRVRANGCSGATPNSNTASGTTLPQTPDVPGTSAASSIGCTAFTANWPSSARSTSYFLQIDNNSDFSSPIFSSNVGNVTSYTQSSGLSAGTRYYYRVAGVNVCGTSAYSGSVAVDMLPTTPTAPVATIATAGCNSFTANWGHAGSAPGNNATTYFIDISTSPTFATLDIRNNHPVGYVTSFTQSGLAASATYYYRVRGANTCGGSGASSNTVSVVTMPPAPSAPVIGTGTGIGCTFFTANWGSSAGTATYYIDISTSPTFASTIRTDIVDASSYPNGAGGSFTFPPGSSADVIALEACESVYGSGNCSVGSCGSFTYYYQTGAPSCSCAKPAGSYEFVYYNDGGYTGVGQDYGGQMTSIVGAVPFTRMKSSGGCDGNSWTLNQPNLGTTASSITSFLETGLNAGVTYYYRVRAGNNCGTSGNSAISAPVTLLPATPDVPVGATPGTPTCTSITANWVTSARATAYILDISTSPTFATLDIQNGLNLGTATTYTQTGLTAGVNYYYRARGTNSCGTSASSGTITAPTLPATPAVPTPAAATGIGCSSFTANWSAPANATSYLLDIASDAGFSTLVFSGTVTTNSHTQSSGVFAGNTYYYRVRAANVCGTSGFSSAGTAVMLPATPAINATSAPSSIGCTSFTANWTSSANATTYYFDVANDAGFTSMVSSSSTSSLFASITGLTAGNSYHYRVRASNVCGTAANSDTRSATLLPPAPGTPTADAASGVECSEFTANWSANSPFTATNHFVDVSTTPTFATFVPGWNNHVFGVGTSIPVTGLTIGETYYYRVRANNSCGLTASSNTEVVTLDKVPVITSCPGDITLNTNAAICDATVNFNDAIAIGPEQPTISYSQLSGSNFPLGNTTVYITATNDCGADNCDFTVTVNDAEPPTILCPDAQGVELDASCYAELPDYTGLASAFDNCSTAPEPGLPANQQPPNSIIITQLPLPGTSLSVGVVTVELTATDATGNVNTCTFDVFVQDNIAPQPVVQDISISLDASGNASITEFDVDAGSYDNCGVAYTLVYPNTFTCTEVGVQEVTFEIGDINGNVTTTSVFITVVDDIIPEAICQDVTVELDDFGSYYDDGFGLGSLVDAGSNDACGISSLFVSPSAFSCFELGTNAVTLEVTDGNGNINTCPSTVTVQDNIAPIITCAGDVTIDCEASTDPSNTGESTATDNVDACAAAVITYADANGQNPDNLDPGYYNYSIVRTWTATDGTGNFTTCDQTITVQDVTAPTVECPADVTINCEDDNTSASNGVATGTDICSAAVYITEGDVSTQDGDNLNGGYYNYTITRTWTSTDVSGNFTTCDQTITVQDITEPTVTCPADVTINCEDDNTSASNGMATGTDICSAAIYITEGDVNGQNPDNLDAGFYNYTITRTWTSTDVSGNFTTCDQTITVQDITAPTVSCPVDVTINCEDDNTSASNGVATGTDICSAAIYITEGDVNGQNPDNLDAGFYNYTITRTWTSTDVSGNFTTCDQTITVQDITAPTVSCPADVTINCEDDNTSASNGVATGTDICSAAIYITEGDASTQDPNNLNAGYYNYTITRTWTSTDVSGNFTTCDQTITVQDITEPTVTCPVDVTINCEDDNTSASNGVATGTDICSAAVYITESDLSTQNPATLDPGYYNYTITRTWTSTDVSGNFTTCDQIITVQDITAPTVTCPADVTINCEDDNTSASNGVATGTDICSATVYITQNEVHTQDPNDLHIGHYNYTITRTWRSTDVTGNFTECDQVITVQDITAPTVTCPADVTINCEDNDASASNGVATGTDICSAAIYITESDESTQDINNLNTGYYNYTITRTWRSTDVTGNFTECDQVITVQDVTPPTANCPVDITINCEDDNTSAANGVATGTDICSAAVYITESDVNVQDIDDAVSGHYNYLITRTWRSTDVTGNFTECEQTITVQDVTDPTVTCPADVTINCQDDNTSAANGVATGTDICSAAIYITESDVSTQDPNNLNAGYYNYYIVRTWRSTDVSGNFTECDQIVTVQDVTNPTVTCPADVLINCEADNTSASNGAARGTDICSAAIYITESDVNGQDPSTTSCGHFNYTITRTWRSTDVTGNFTECNQIVTVQDTTSPTFTVPADITLYSDVNCSYDASLAVTGDVTNEADNCATGIEATHADVIVDGPTGSHIITRTWTLNDYCGNTADTMIQVVTVVDVIQPTAICQDITIQLDASGNASIIPGQVDDGSFDNCEIASLAVAPNTFTCFEVGTNPVTLTVTDVNGNISICNSVVTVQDTVTPIALCRNIGIQLDALGEATITASQIDNGSNDACGIDSISVSPFKFGCDQVGTNTVILTVIDNNNNVSSCTATVLVQDKTPAVSICQNVTIELNSSGLAYVTANMINNGSNDACGIDSLAANVTAFPCDSVGDRTVTLTVTDNNGNTSQCNSVVTIQDNIAPTAICKDHTVTLNSFGAANITPLDIDNASYDNCAIQSLDVLPNAFDCSDIGANAVILTVIDVNGNVTTCGASVQVIGLIPTCSIASVPANNTFTGGVPTNIYLGYGPQSVTLQSTMLNGIPQFYSWTCSNPNWIGRVSCTTCANPVFTPLVTGNYTFTATITNNYGCVTTCSITICVLDVRAPGGGNKVYMSHYPNGQLPCASNSQCNNLIIAISAVSAHLAHTCDHLGMCFGSGIQICAPSAKNDEGTEEESSMQQAIADGDFGVSVYPNPFSDQFRLSVSSTSGDNLEIKVFDVLGQLIENRRGVAIETDLSFGGTLSKGVYLVEVSQGENLRVVRVVKSE